MIEIYKTYYGKRVNISKGAQIIHNFLFQKNTKRNGGNVSKYTKKDADILTNFFTDLKAVYSQNSNNIGGIAKGMLLQQEVDKIPVLDFAKGGKSQAGIEFEREFEKLFIQNFEQSQPSVSGQATATSYIDLGTDDIEKAKKLLESFIEDDINQKIDDLEKQLVSGIEIGKTEVPTNLFLKIGSKRFGKIDFKANSTDEINILIQGDPKGDLATALNLLKTASFSLKSYTTNRRVHLGSTDPKKAISAVSEYVASRVYNGKNSVRGVGIYYLYHPTNKGKAKEKEARDELYEHYDHMRKVYELTGIGLQYNDVGDLYNVDFLLVNRANSKTDIKVYAVQELLSQLAQTGKYNI